MSILFKNLQKVTSLPFFI